MDHYAFFSFILFIIGSFNNIYGIRGFRENLYNCECKKLNSTFNKWESRYLMYTPFNYTVLQILKNEFILIIFFCCRSRIRQKVRHCLGWSKKKYIYSNFLCKLTVAPSKLKGHKNDMAVGMYIYRKSADIQYAGSCGPITIGCSKTVTGRLHLF